MVRFSVSEEVPASAPPLKKIKISPLIEEQDENFDLVHECPRRVNAAFDMDILECHVCLELLSAPVYQCPHGHVVCSDCKRMTSNKCATCSEKIGTIRCLAIEKLIDSLRVSCMYADFGCSKKIRFVTKNMHESKCSFLPYSCPIYDCNFLAAPTNFSSHLLESHQVRTCELSDGLWCTILLESDEGKVVLKVDTNIFLLYNDKGELGNLVFLKIFGSMDQEMCFMYHLVVRKGKRRLSLESHPKSILTVEKCPCDFLLVPLPTYSSQDSLEVELCIRKIENDKVPLVTTKGHIRPLIL